MIRLVPKKRDLHLFTASFTPQPHLHLDKAVELSVLLLPFSSATIYTQECGIQCRRNEGHDFSPLPKTVDTCNNHHLHVDNKWRHVEVDP